MNLAGGSRSQSASYINVNSLIYERSRQLNARDVSFGAMLDATDEGRGDAFPAELVTVPGNCEGFYQPQCPVLESGSLSALRISYTSPSPSIHISHRNTSLACHLPPALP